MSDTNDLEPIGKSTVAIMRRVERIMSQRAEATETIRKSWIAGEIAALPCHDRCDGDIIVEIGDRKERGYCPAHMQVGTCPLTLLAEKELRARLTRAGFGRRYHAADPERIRGREAVEAWLSNVEQNLADGRGLILSGDTGVGKTMTLGYIARRLLVENHGCWKVTHEQFVTLLMDIATRKEAVRRAVSVQVLMLDDWGSAEMATWVIGIMEGIVESRYGNQMPVIVTTNMTRDQIKNAEWMNRITDRWRQAMTLVEVGGSSQRVQE